MNSSFDSSCDDSISEAEHVATDNETLAIVPVIVNVIETIVARTRPSQGDTRPRNAFHTEALPGISIRDYLVRIITYTHVERSTLICALIYMDRLSSAGVAVNGHSVHKVLFTSILMSMKFNEDCIYTISFFAEVAGVTVPELLSMESEFVNKINFNFHVDETVFNTYASLLTQ